MDDRGRNPATATFTGCPEDEGANNRGADPSMQNDNGSRASRISTRSCQPRPRGQTALEYLMIIGGLVVLVLMVIMLLNSAVFSQAVNAMNQSLAILGPIKK